VDDSFQERIDPATSGERGLDPPHERVARNETTARRVNEAIEAGRVTRDGLAGFLCECGRLGCNEVVELALGEYEAVRASARQFVIVDGHEADFDAVVSRTPRYAVVAKQGIAGTIAQQTDPRAETGP
jgi:hypothetical protein